MILRSKIMEKTLALHQFYNIIRDNLIDGWAVGLCTPDDGTNGDLEPILISS